VHGWGTAKNKNTFEIKIIFHAPFYFAVARPVPFLPFPGHCSGADKNRGAGMQRLGYSYGNVGTK
jgi:hypothetical protein